MTSVWRFFFALVTLAFFGVAHADGEDVRRSLTMKCQYSDYTTSQLVSVSIDQGTAESVEVSVPASIKIFRRGTPRLEQVVFHIPPGQFAECVFPSKKRVRVKIGEGSARAYGMCGGDPQVFASVWVDGRKLLSRLWFAGHCIEDTDSSSFSLQVSSNKVIRCQTVTQVAAVKNVPGFAGTLPLAEPLVACVNFPDVARFPVDPVEYPLPATRPAAVGSVEVLRGNHPVCRVVADANTEGSANGSITEHVSLLRPAQGEASADLPGGLAGATESIYDFNNDGDLDRIFFREFENTYMHGSVLLVQLGTKPKALQVTGPLLGANSILAPCQMGTTKYSIDACPPFSQRGDDSGFAVRSRPGEAPVYFYGRYAEVKPFFFRGSTYVEVASHAGESSEYVAVLKPLPNRSFDQTCLLRTVPENF